MSASVPRAISVNGLPLTGETFSKYSPFTGGTHSPPMKWSYRDFTRDQGVSGSRG